MSSEMHQLADAVTDEASLLAFIAALAAEWQMSQAIEASPYGPNALGWENGTVGAFLEAAARWGEASESGLPLAGYQPPSNPWCRAAHILLAGKFYE